MTELRYVTGDATDPQGDGVKIIPHICNDVGAWGAGFVLALSKRWPEPEKRYRHPYRPLVLGDVDLVDVEEDIVVANMIAQHGINALSERPPIRYGALAIAMRKVAGQLQGYGNVSIHAPRFGSGLAGGNWDIIELLILELWVDKGIPVTVYDLPGGR